MNPEDFDSDFDPSFDDSEILEEMIKKREKKFSEGCTEGFKLLQKHGGKSLDSTDVDSAKEALSRMVGYFIQVEHYEKCSYIQQIYREEYNEEISPIFPKFLS